MVAPLVIAAAITAASKLTSELIASGKKPPLYPQPDKNRPSGFEDVAEIARSMSLISWRSIE